MYWIVLDIGVLVGTYYLMMWSDSMRVIACTCAGFYLHNKAASNPVHSPLQSPPLHDAGKCGCNFGPQGLGHLSRLRQE